MMPEELNSPSVAMLPERFAELTHRAVVAVTAHA
jgi:hypothetical protein